MFICGNKLAYSKKVLYKKPSQRNMNELSNYIKTDIFSNFE